MILSDAQLEEYRAFGYLLVREMLDAGEVGTMTDEYERNLAATEPLFATPIGTRGQMTWSNMRPETPFLAELLEDSTLSRAAEQLLGEGVVGVMSNGNHFSGRFTDWHADTGLSRFRGLKIVCYLEPLDGDSGALRVIPGSHHDSFGEALARIGLKGPNVDPEAAEDEEGRHVARVPAQICDTEPGDAILFDLRTWHASCNARGPRRMCSFTYFADPRTEDQEAATLAMAAQLKKEALFREVRRQRAQLKLHGAAAVRSGPRPPPQYSEPWIAEAEANPRRARWIDRLKAWGMMG